MKKAWLPAIVFLLMNLSLMAADFDTTFTETTVVLQTATGDITVKGNRKENLAAYITSTLPISEELVNSISTFELQQ